MPTKPLHPYDSAKIWRDLHLATPLPKGKDVEALQHHLNEFAAHHPQLAHYHLKEDGQLGEHTKDAAKRAVRLLGLPKSRIEEVDRGHIVQRVQTLIRHPDQRSDAEKKEAEKRQEQARKALNVHGAGAARAIAWAKSKVGISEAPPDSNRGPQIDVWQAYCNVAGMPWCGCFVAYATVHEASAKVPDHERIRYSGWIDYDARARVNGMVSVPVAEARAGDIGTINFDGGVTDHVVLITGPPSGGLLPTVEGNTSPSTAGSQFNGGCVAVKQRASGLFYTVARIVY